MNYSIGLSAMRTSQFAINIGSQNIANANSPEYHRQRVLLTARPPQWVDNRFLGNGVDVRSVDRIRNGVLASSYTRSLSEMSGIGSGLSVLRQIESEFLLGDGSVHQTVSSFFSELTRMSANPDQRVGRDAAINEAVQIAQRINSSYGRLDELKQRLHSQVQTEVDVLNQELTELVHLQNQIASVSIQGALPNDLLDKRDQLVNKIAEKIDVERIEHLQNGMGLTVAGGTVGVGVVPPQFAAVRNADGSVGVVLAGTDRQVQFQSGSIATALEAHNSTINQYQHRLNEWASTFIREMDQAHAQGVGTSGPFNVLRSTRFVENVNTPLAHSGLAFPVQAGELHVTLTSEQGEKRTHSISINPQTQSLQDIAAQLNSIDHLTATVDPATGQLSVFAQSGHRFDFTGSLETIPGLSSFTGTSVPRFSGDYQGSVNRNLNVTIVGSGTIGETPGLIARVTDAQTGAVIADLDIGENYEAGSPLELPDGVQLSFSAGTVVDSEPLSTPLVANSDTSGILSALGLNSFFSGSNASDIRVSQRILENPNDFATSRSGDLADTSNLMKMIELREKRTVGELKMTFQDYVSDLSTSIGFEVQLQERLLTNVVGLNQQYESEIRAISGVDLNEEMLSIAQFQKQYEAAIQVLRVMDSMMSELMMVIR